MKSLRVYIYSLLIYSCFSTKSVVCTFSATESIEDLCLDYEDDRNSMIAVADKENFQVYDEFYDELDNRIRVEQSMNMIYFGPPSSFLRLDPESILHILSHTKKPLIPIARSLLAWDVLTDGKTAAFLQGREYLALGMLLNEIPEEDLYYVNFGDPSVLKYFATNYIMLDARKVLQFYFIDLSMLSF
ncbi:unnamed protein product [Chrysodeixis includens]|uniref:Uncharacterized protein n=1 Tax=Chrysodeixis includens TaxID=689277 RepID=A0A9N8L0J3_CHRIL|nr:unnamed protein product [Chrysodeixis includens]